MRKSHFFIGILIFISIISFVSAECYPVGNYNNQCENKPDLVCGDGRVLESHYNKAKPEMSDAEISPEKEPSRH